MQEFGKQFSQLPAIKKFKRLPDFNTPPIQRKNKKDTSTEGIKPSPSRCSLKPHSHSFTPFPPKGPPRRVKRGAEPTMFLLLPARGVSSSVRSLWGDFPAWKWCCSNGQLCSGPLSPSKWLQLPSPGPRARGIGWENGFAEQLRAGGFACLEMGAIRAPWERPEQRRVDLLLPLTRETSSLSAEHKETRSASRCPSLSPAPKGTLVGGERLRREYTFPSAAPNPARQQLQLPPTVNYNRNVRAGNVTFTPNIP